MIQKCFFLVLMLVPSIVMGINEMEESIDGLHRMDVVLQDSIICLQEDAKEIHAELKNVTSGTPNQKMANLEKSVDESGQKMVELLQWKKDVDAKLSQPKGGMDLAILNKYLQPLQSEVKKMHENLQRVSQKGKSVQDALTHQIIQMGNIFDRLTVQEKTSANEIELVKKDIQQSNKSNKAELKAMRDTIKRIKTFLINKKP